MSPSNAPILLAPPSGSTLANNTPQLCWTAVSATGIEVWIDGIRLAELPAGATCFIPFPLSFGRHEWQVVAVSGPDRWASAAGGFVLEDQPLTALPAEASLLRLGWQVQSSRVVGMDGARLSAPVPSQAEEGDGWFGTSVPSTVLGALVRNAVYPDPYTHLNIHRIPDVDDNYNAKWDRLRFSHLPGINPWKDPWWFRTNFRLPARAQGRLVWLNLQEINYRAEVWLNGQLVAGPDAVVGIDRRFRFDVTRLVKADGANCLAIAIHQLDDPGAPDLPRQDPLGHPGRNMGADERISVNYTKWDTAGWDWQPAIPDRDMGITEDVFLSYGDAVEIRDPYVSTQLAPDGNARVCLEFDLVNHGETDWRGLVTTAIQDAGGQRIEFQTIASAPGTKRPAASSVTRIRQDADANPGLCIAQPRLWWPVGLGEPHLYKLSLGIDDGTVQAACELDFGIRSLESYLHPATKTRAFKINGRELFIQGGNWVADMLLSATAGKLAHEIRIAAHAGTNFLRIWGPTSAPPQALFDAADRHGVLIQQDFLNDFWGTDKNRAGCCPDLEIFRLASADLIKRFRNHPSLVLWCGGNEGPNPREELLKNELLPALDPHGQRHYLIGSDKDGLQGGGPYHNLPPDQYWDNPKISGFNSEIGPSGLPPWESLSSFIHFPPSAWAKGRYPLDAEFACHDATDRSEDTRKFSNLDNALRQRFGEPSGTDLAAARSWSDRAQLLNHDTYQAVAEALNSQLWTKATGYALWKYNSSWPSVTWQITDWYLRQHAGTYALRRAQEPLHVQMNLTDRKVAVINRDAEPRAGLRIQASMVDASGQVSWTGSALVDAEPAACTPAALTVPTPARLAFLLLVLHDASGQAVSRNLAWQAPGDALSGLLDLPPPELACTRLDGKLRIRNSGRSVALLVRCRLLDRRSAAEILPCLWDENWVNLLPGEEFATGWDCCGVPAQGPVSVEVSALGMVATCLELG